jgi:ABC-type lipoprotein release transport system permease subunit
MKWILRFFSWRYARRRPVRALLNVAVVALGVALYVAVDASNAGTEAAFRQMVGRLTGNTQLQVVGPLGGGVDEALLARIDGRRGVKAAPVLQVATTVTQDRSGSPLLVLGLDLAREALFQRWSFAGDEVKEMNLLTFLLYDSVVITRRFADRHGLAVGRSFQIDTPDGPRPVKVGAIP